ncbi:MAG: phosphoribosylanthranilate isomerase [Chloroflexi bacterium]|nr:phosphoribosylanthranilate isomerase [Chloroflexota bacterium]MCL5273756.1 phosphoribosylanthranilate isomerase [Chloroflexota bacterium]
MTIVKICGLTNLEDALCAVEAGADLLGFILYPRSPRYIEPQNLSAIVAAVHTVKPEITTVGVFVNETPERIRDILSTTGLALAQLSGDEPLSHLTALQGRAYKVVRTREQADAVISALTPLHRPPRLPCPDLMLDADHPALYGGSGAKADESLAASLGRSRRLLLAGGLTPANVAHAVQQAQPWGVDVSSGVEASPGRKDHDRIRSFIQAVRRQDGR